MSMIKKFQCEALNCSIDCLMVNGEPWFNGQIVAESLGYDRPTKAIHDHVPEKFKTPFKTLISASGLYLPNSGTYKRGEAKTLFISEAGLYRLIFKSRLKEAQAFCDWVCSEVLPSIRKTGSYSFDQVKQMAKGENRLQYRVIEHMKDKYPDVIILPGLGEYQDREFLRIDASLKGYIGGQPDIILLRKLSSDFTDVMAIELKNPNGSNWLSEKQVRFIRRLETCNVTTMVADNYEDVVIGLHDHYREVEKKVARLAITDETYDFSTRSNAKYWVAKLKNKATLIRECQKRGIKTTNLVSMTNIAIAEMLMAADFLNSGRIINEADEDDAN